MKFTEAECQELRAPAKSEALSSDMAHVAATRHNPFIVNGEVDTECYIEFLTQYNEFLNHPFKPVRPFIKRNMKL